MMKVSSWLITVLILLFTRILIAQDLQQADSVLVKDRLTPLIVSTAAVYSGTLIYLSSEWYSEYEKQTWQFFNDAREWKQVDKVGHFYGAYQLQRISYETFQWAGLTHKKSLLWSGVSSFAFMATIEVMDGFSTGYGASATDLVANTVGIGMYTGQQLLWNEVRIHPKFTFHSSSYAAFRPDVLGSNLAEEIIKDYNGQSYWLSIDVSKFVNGKFPKWLNIAVGYGAEGMVYAEDSPNTEAGFNSYRQWYLGLDLDVSNIHTRSKFLNTVLFFVDMVRIPAPTLEFSDGSTKWHWLY